jgi:hypothetical protein
LLADNEKILKNFLTETGTLKTIPSSFKKRLIILEWLVGIFESDQSYTELEVNQLIKPIHPDFATLRRELVDSGFLKRENGIYNRVHKTP